jgi:hypothetical protein
MITLFFKSAPCHMRYRFFVSLTLLFTVRYNKAINKDAKSGACYSDVIAQEY